MSEFKLTDEQKELAKKLTPLQYKFVVNLVGGMSQRKAIKAAGSNAKSDNTLDNSASECLSKPKVRAFYDSLMASKAISGIMTRSEALVILSNNARVAMTDVADFTFQKVGEDENGADVMQTVWKMKDSKDIRPEVISCIKSVTMTKQGPKIELHDQQGAIKQLSALEGWDAPKKTELTGKDGAQMVIKADVSSPDIAAALSGLMGKL